MLTMCLSVCLWAQIARTPFNYMIAAGMLSAKCDDYQFQRLILQFPALGKNYCITSMFITTQAVKTIEMFSKEKVAPCLVRQTIPWSSNKLSRKHGNTELKSTMTSLLCLILSKLFSLKTLSPQTWITTISSGWQRFSSASVVALRVD